MAKKRKKTKKKDQDSQDEEISSGLTPETQKGIVIVALFAVAAISALAIFGFAGRAGEEIDKIFIFIFGYGKYLFPLLLAGIGYVLIYPDRYYLGLANYIGVGLFLLSALGILNIIEPDDLGGGRLGMVLSYPLVQLSTVWVAVVVILALLVVSVLLMFNTSIASIIEKLPSTGFIGKIGGILLRIFGKTRDAITRKKDDFYEEEFEESEEDEKEFDKREIDGEESEPSDEDDEKDVDEEPEQMELIHTRKKKRKIDIPLDLLNDKNEKPTSGDIKRSKEIIHHTLESFGIETELGEVSVGPTVTQYTLKPSEGVKLAQITTLANDLSLALAAHPIRIEAPIPGKSLVGIEVPNKAVAMVGLKEVLKSEGFKKRPGNLTLCLGRDVAGKSYLVDLDPMPHLLIAGSTGSGKSVCINSIIMSLLYQNGPDDLKLILVDPKRVEFTAYNGIPHLLTPVITDVQKTINALKWIVNEMDRRYELLSESGKRNIQDYNKNGTNMPYIVLVIDELADLMAIASREVEAAITRLAQMARAVGIHLVLATQRPSVDVITGLIKANITSRAAFNVASLIDSRTILDHSGAEKLLGKGDMLYISANLGKPKRLQGAYLVEEEINNVVKYLKSKANPDYEEEVTEKPTKKVMPEAYNDGEDEDELLDEAKDVILKAKKASASLLQRRLRIGYARAARILDILEEQGIIGPADGAKPREILVSTEEVDDGYEDAKEEGEEEEYEEDDR